MSWLNDIFHSNSTGGTIFNALFDPGGLTGLGNAFDPKPKSNVDNSPVVAGPTPPVNNYLNAPANFWEGNQLQIPGLSQYLAQQGAPAAPPQQMGMAGQMGMGRPGQIMGGAGRGLGQGFLQMLQSGGIGQNLPPEFRQMLLSKLGSLGG